MIQNYRNTYENMTVRIDNQSFESCVFKNCLIEYGGNGLFILKENVFDNCQWTFTGPAQNTLKFLWTMYHQMGDFGKEMVESLFDDLKKSGPKKEEEITEGNEGSTNA